jgi:hypothetical protein
MKSLEMEQMDSKTKCIFLIQFMAFQPKESLNDQLLDEEYCPAPLNSEET